VLGQKSIGLIGFMGSGKTTVGEALAAAIGWNFIDTDSVIEKRTGKPIHRIFKEDGEEHFRDLEAEVVHEVCLLDSVVISFGGGVLIKPTNAAMITENTVVVLLKVSIDTVDSRTSSDHNRPLLELENTFRRERITSLLAEREKQYKEAADIVINTDVLSINEVVTEITGRGII
jgi:shikimate kinase